ncbi:hypothetical protein GGS23DRAFT_482534 [Durotheca rogersii]|uniref:uncharacterized protein n=1 Tax=Durotheca rogersii TaxID=419775 RepID=UPI0022202712|nr:uncharacterized protein GGS23DRAFT_482534 [Durotheca rogersii]KAI5864097.1 hypothetical protein GGS23DRAFT_482534 [Durotheca rogersii]
MLALLPRLLLLTAEISEMGLSSWVSTTHHRQPANLDGGVVVKLLARTGVTLVSHTNVGECAQVPSSIHPSAHLAPFLICLHASPHAPTATCVARSWRAPKALGGCVSRQQVAGYLRSADMTVGTLRLCRVGTDAMIRKGDLSRGTPEPSAGIMRMYGMHVRAGGCGAVGWVGGKVPKVINIHETRAVGTVSICVDMRTHNDDNGDNEDDGVHPNVKTPILLFFIVFLKHLLLLELVRGTHLYTHARQPIYRYLEGREP